MTDLLARRDVLRFLGLTPLGALACGDDGGSGRADLGPLPRDLSTPPRDGALDAFRLDGASPDASMSECLPTSSDALGPFFESGAPGRSSIATMDEPGDRLLFAGVLADITCAPLADMRIDLWQADQLGNYYDAGADFRLRGHVITDADGGFAFSTIVPGNYETGSGPRPAHLHLRVSDPAGGVRLVTQIYFAGDPNLGGADGCQPPTCFSNDAARILDLTPMDDLLIAETRIVV